jgi:CubicO group peptidase (beta-lactamase class C family)
MHVDEMSGVAIARRGGVTVAERVGGLADRDLGAACTPETRFQIASVSKQFTAAAVLLLVGESRLSLDDPISRWLEGCPRDWDAITIHHLLTHTAGLGHWEGFPALDLHQPIEPAHVLLARIVEQAAAQPYAGFLPLRGDADHAGRTAPRGPGKLVVHRLRLRLANRRHRRAPLLVPYR